MISGLLFLHKGYRIQKAATDTERARLAALEIARPDLAEGHKVNLDFFTQFDAGSYFSAVDAFGSPALTTSQLASSSEANRADADVMLASLLNLSLGEASEAKGLEGARRRCQATGANSAPGQWAPLEPGVNWLMPNGPPADLRLARFADGSCGGAGIAWAAPQGRNHDSPRPINTAVAAGGRWARIGNRLSPATLSEHRSHCRIRVEGHDRNG